MHLILEIWQYFENPLTHIEAEWCIYALVNYTITGSDNGLSPGWCQAIIWTNAGILLIGPLGTNFSEIIIKIHAISLKKMNLKPFCLCLDVFGTQSSLVKITNGSLPDSTEPLHEPMLTNHQWGHVAFIWGWVRKSASDTNCKNEFEIYTLKITSTTASINELKHIETRTKWLTFCKQHFQMHFLESIFLYFDQICISK